jgi:hypothetical protein
MEIIYFHKKPTGGRFYLSLVRLLCFWQHNLSAVTGIPGSSSEGYFDCLLTEDLAPAVFSLYVSISALLRLRHRFSIQL